jgi:hypothetical protein
MRSFYALVLFRLPSKTSFKEEITGELRDAPKRTNFRAGLRPS